jgi:hypothetical protein
MRTHYAAIKYLLMQNFQFLKKFRPITLVFILSSVFFIVWDKRLTESGISPDVAIMGNLILFIATLISFYLYYKALQNDRVAVFLRMIYGGMFIKMMLCLFAAIIYISIAGKSTNKGGIFICMFLYFLYTFLEMSILMKLSKQLKNGQAGSST